MGLTEFVDAQNQNAASFGRSPHFASLIPLVDRMYEVLADTARTRHSPTLLKLLMVSHREFLVAATLIQRGLPFDSQANTRRAIEIAKVALALKRNPKNADEWLKADLRQKRWDARIEGKRPVRLPALSFSNLTGEPLLQHLEEHYGIASDTYIHFTPEYLGQQAFTEKPRGDEMVTVQLNYFTDERTILSHAIMLAGLHVRILMIFDAVFENIGTADPGWMVLKTTCDKLALDLFRELRPLASS